MGRLEEKRPYKQVSYSGYYATLPRWKRGFDSRYLLHVKNSVKAEFFFDKTSRRAKLSENLIMKTIYLVRHGHIENPKKIFYDGNIPLSEIGAKEMMGIADDIKSTNCTPKRIISSTFLRTRESAETIAHVFGNPEVEFDERLIDWQVGDWIGKPLEEFRRYAGYYNEPFVPNFKGLETYDGMANRVLEVINELRDTLPEDSCLIILGHREPLASALLKLLQKPDTDMRKIDFPKGSAWKLIYEDNKLSSAEKTFDRSSEETKKDVI